MKIVDSDAFLEMPLSTQCLYFHLNMRADDDGFIGNPKKIMRIIGASDDDLRLLIYSVDLTIRERLQGSSHIYERERQQAEELKEKLENRLAKDH